MKIKVFFTVFLLFPLFLSCSLSRAKPKEGGETAATVSKSDQAQKPTTAVGETKLATSPSGTATQAVAAAPTKASSTDQAYVVNELTFEVKKLNAELKNLQTQMQDLQANSQMWMNPLAMYDKEIITDNGSSIYGKIIYQDDKIVKVETLIGYLVLEKANIVRVVTNVPQEPAQKYLPEELASDLKTGEAQPAMPQAPYVSKGTEPAQIPESTAKTANCVLVGNIKEQKDRSGNTVFSGEVKNIGARRADFVKVNFIFRKNWSGDTKTSTVFVEGSYFTFEDSGITTNNSLLPGASGKFELMVPKSFGTFIGYSYTIEWEQYQ
jgi:hypothetical protein